MDSRMCAVNRCSLTLPAWPPSALAPLSENTMTSVLSSAAEALERGEHAADLRIGVGQEAGEDLLLAGEHAPLVGREVGPGLHPLGTSRQHRARRAPRPRRAGGRTARHARRPSPCRTRPGRGRPTRAPRGAARAWRPGRSTGRRACPAPPAAGPAPCGPPGRPGPRSGGSPPRAGEAPRCSGCRRPGSAPSDSCRPGGTRSSARSPSPSGQVSKGPAAERCQRGVRCHLPTAIVE